MALHEGLDFVKAQLTNTHPQVLLWALEIPALELDARGDGKAPRHGAGSGSSGKQRS